MLKLKKEKQKTESEKQLDNLKAELRECNTLLKRSEDKFHFATDENLIEARIYEMKYLSKHRDYIMSQIKGIVYRESRNFNFQEIV